MSASLFVSWLVVGPGAHLASAQAAATSRPRPELRGREFTVDWVEPPTWPATTEISAGWASGHGIDLDWVKIRPVGDRVEVLRFQWMDRSLGSERPNVVLSERAVLAGDQHRSLVADLSAIQAARLSPIPGDPWRLLWSSSADFWASIRATAGGEVLFADDWCGYPSGELEMRYAKVQAAALRALLFNPPLEWEPYEPSEKDRAEAAARAAADLKRLHAADCDCVWWMGERLTGLGEAIGPFSSLAQRSKWRAVRIRIVDPAGNPIAEASVRVLPVSPKRELRPDDDGIELPHAGGTWVAILRSGPFVAVVRAAGFKASRHPLTVGESSPQEFVVRLE